MTLEKLCKKCKKSYIGVRNLLICSDKIISNLYIEKGITPYCYKLNHSDKCEQYHRSWLRLIIKL